MVNTYPTSIQGSKMLLSHFLKRGLLLLSFTLLAFSSSYGQERNVSGRVLSADDNAPLPGVNVLLKGTSSGTVTDLNGNYKISVPSGESILVFSFIGYGSEEIQVGAQSTINVNLTTDISELNEIVVIGYGTIEKKDATGTLAKVSTKEFNKGVISSPDQLIVGKVAGLQINSNGDPGGGAGIRLRGVSINGEYPLIVVDGVPLAEGGGGVTGGRNPLNFINPSDIADMTVLKDASATAIYGARGANGVIMITTKSGVAGKPKITYDGFYGVSIFTRKPDILSTDEFRQVIKVKAPQALPTLGTADTDWLKEVTRMGQNMQHNVGMSGGFKKTTYTASLNYLKNQGVLRYSDHERINLALRVEQKLLKDKLSLTFNTKNGFTNDLFGPNVIGAANAYDPTRPVYDESNTATGGYYQWTNSIAVGNPVADQEQQNSEGKTFRSLSNLAIRYQIPFIDGLAFNANLSYDYNDGTSTYTRDPLARASVNSGSGRVESENGTIRKNNLYEYFADYKKQFGKHKVDAAAGYAWQNFRSDFTLTYFDENPAPDPVIDAPYVENRLISYFGRMTYDYSGKYLLTGSLRRDGSTRFSPENRWGLFPSLAAGWRVLEENFAAPLTNVFTELKVRASYGVTGNEQIGDYLYSTYYRPSLPGASYQFGDAYVQTLTPNAADPNLKWEETRSSNFGIDASMMNGKLTLSIDYYIKNVNDLIFTIAAPAGSVPGDRITTNIGEVSNKGIELVGSSVLYDNKDFKWNLGFNISYNKNEIVKLDNKSGEDLSEFPGYRSGGISGDIGQTIQIRKVGEPIDAFFVYRHKLNPDGSLVLDTNGDGIQSNLEMYEDLNGDGIINENDLAPLHQPQPKVLMGLTSNMTWKKWDMALTLRGSWGNYVYNNLASSTGYYQRLTDVVTNNIHASALETDFKTRQLFSDYYVQNGSFVKLDNITLGYNFDEFSFGRVRAYLTVQNPLIVSPYKGVEPELFGGIDNNPYPRSMTFTVGVNATFK